jgi:hypothetical protein
MAETASNPRGARIHRRYQGEVPDRIRCRVCNFPGVSVEATPGENFPTALVTTGSTYVWAASTDALSTLDLTVLPTPNPAVSCPFCGATRYMDGSRGSGQ